MPHDARPEWNFYVSGNAPRDSGRKISGHVRQQDRPPRAEIGRHGPSRQHGIPLLPDRDGKSPDGKTDPGIRSFAAHAPQTDRPAQERGRVGLEILASQVLNLGHLLHGRNGELLRHALVHGLRTDLLALGGLLVGSLHVLHLEDIDARHTLHGS